MNTLFESSGEAPEAPIPNGTNPPPRILLVEDARALRQCSARALTWAGYHVDVAEDGATAWEALQTNHYNLLITDHNMPKVTGLELVKKLRAARMDLPVILTSAALPTEELELHPGLQLAATLQKPFDANRFLDAVNKVLRAPTEQAADRVAAAPPAAYG